MTVHEILKKLKSMGNPKDIKGMARFGITPEKTYGVRIPDLRKLAKEIGRNQELSLKLWDVDTRETRILAAMTGEPDKVTGNQMESWAKVFDFWEICDQCCMNLFEKTPLAYDKAVEYSSRPEEFVKRTGFVLMARLAVSDKKAKDRVFRPFFPLILKESDDDRVMVKKAVNWALRQIGKRNRNLNKEAVGTAKKMLKLDSKAARWVAFDALRELESDAVQQRLRER